MRLLFAKSGAWDGGFYELAIEVGPRFDAALAACLKAIWRSPNLYGCYAYPIEPELQQKIEPTLEALQEYRHLLGVATLANGAQVPCGTVAIREDEGPDWLDLYLPLGSLETVFPDVGGFPFESPEDRVWARPWREEIDLWFAKIGIAAYDSVKYKLGIIGFEVSGTEYSKDFAGDAPEDRRDAYLWPDKQGGVKYLPVTSW